MSGTTAAARLGLVAMAFTIATSNGPAVAQEYYAGKTINFVVGFAPGGSTDTSWRAVAPFMAKHIPGNPRVVIQNMDGGGGMTAANFVYEKARPDGLTLSTGPWNSMGALTKAPGVRIDYTKMSFIGGFPEPLVNYARTDVLKGGLKSPLDIVKATSPTVAGLRPDSSQDLSMRLAFDMLGLKIKYVPGYPGAAQRRAALLSNEAQITSIGYTEYVSAVEPGAKADGSLIGLWYHSLTPRVSIAGMMDFPTVYEKIKGQKPAGEHWELLRTVYLATGVFLQAMMAPPKTPEAALKALAAGYEGLMKDEEFQKLSLKSFGARTDFITSAEGTKTIIELLGSPDQKVVERLNAYIQAGSK